MNYQYQKESKVEKLPKTIQVKVCKNCGTSIEEGNLFCTECGLKIEFEQSIVKTESADEKRYINSDRLNSAKKQTVETILELKKQMNKIKPLQKQKAVKLNKTIDNISGCYFYENMYFKEFILIEKISGNAINGSFKINLKINTALFAIGKINGTLREKDLEFSVTDWDSHSIKSTDFKRDTNGNITRIENFIRFLNHSSFSGVLEKDKIVGNWSGEAKRFASYTKC